MLRLNVCVYIYLSTYSSMHRVINASTRSSPGWPSTTLMTTKKIATTTSLEACNDTVHLEAKNLTR